MDAADARGVVLAKVRAALRDVPTDEPVDVEPERRHRVRGELDVEARLTRFAERLADYGVGVRRARADEVAGAVAAALAEHGAGRIAIPPDLPARWRPAEVELIEDDGLAAAELDLLDGALTGCALAIAETGTVVLAGGPADGRRALTLVPDLHVCVVEAEQLVETVPEAVRVLEGHAAGRASPLTLISGPSATADIELDRVEGVHGPRRLELVIAG